MRGFVTEIGGQIDDLNGFEGTLLHADTASDAQFLRDLRDFRRGRDLDAELSGDLARGTGAHADDRAGPLALLAALLRLAFVRAHDGDSRHLVRLRIIPLSFAFRHFESAGFFSGW